MVLRPNVVAQLALFHSTVLQGIHHVALSQHFLVGTGEDSLHLLLLLLRVYQRHEPGSAASFLLQNPLCVLFNAKETFRPGFANFRDQLDGISGDIRKIVSV